MERQPLPPSRPVIPLTIAGALFGWLVSPMTDGLSAIGILLFTPPPWAIAGFLLGVLIELRDRRRVAVNSPAANQDAPSKPN
jgi:hypothetical protein